MALLQKIPIIPNSADQVLQITLDNNPYKLRVIWNERFGYFSLSIYTADDTPILLNVKMVKNYPLTDRFQNTLLPFGMFFFIQESGSSVRPVFEDLGSSFNLYYYEPDITVSAQGVVSEFVEPLIGTIWDSGMTTWDAGDTTWDQ